jgi:hypothetical protein
MLWSTSMPFGTWNEVGLVVFLAVIIVLATKIGAVGSAVGGFFARKD